MFVDISMGIWAKNESILQVLSESFRWKKASDASYFDKYLMPENDENISSKESMEIGSCWVKLLAKRPSKIKRHLETRKMLDVKVHCSWH